MYPVMTANGTDEGPSPLVLERHTLNLDGADTVALKRLFCGDGTSRIGKKRYTAKLCRACCASQRSKGPRRYKCLILTNT
jgi:hypothetical protein